MGMNVAALYHRSAMEYRYFFDSKLYLRLRTAANDVERATVLYGHRYLPLDLFPQKEAEMTKIATDGINDWWEASFTPDEPRVQYEFRVQKGNEVKYYCEIGIYDSIQVNKAGTNNLNGFVHPHILNCDEISIPNWARGAVVYQIFPDRFNRVGKREPNMVPWGTKPDRRMFAGGNLKGIQEKVPYLKELGVDILYMTPIFEAGSNHRYDTIDYLKIDPMLGTEQDFKDLVEACHANGMHVILDGVFNHCSPKFFAFKDICEKGRDSAYADWFFPHSFPVSFEKGNYDTFSHGAGMPKLNMESRTARDYFLNVLTYWIKECGIDGWRLDVANEIDKGFLREMRVEVKKAKADALLIGEVWTDAGEWLQGDMFDGVMHYQMTFPIRQSWEADSEISDTEFFHRIQMAAMLYQHGVAQASWVMLDSHDTSRMATVAGSKERFLASAFLQFTLPGAPFIYYGDEIGLEGNDDPDCRRCMPWERVESSDILPYFRKLTALKHMNPIRFGRLLAISMEDGVFVYRMNHENGDALCLLNRSDKEVEYAADFLAKLGFEAEREYMRDVKIGEPFILRPYEGLVFLTKEREVPNKKILRAKDFRQMKVDLRKLYAEMNEKKNGKD